MAKFEYETLSNADKEMLARDRQRGLESDHYRISLSADEEEKARRLPAIEAEIETVKAERESLATPPE